MTEGAEGTVSIESVPGLPIPYEMQGAMRDCTLSGGEMTPSAHGYCQGGIVYLTIVEDWGPYQGVLTCPDGRAEFRSSPLGVMTHSGADGRGEVFYLDDSFSSEGAGYTSIRPFQAGSGEHIWTLFYDPLGPVVP